MSEKRITIRLNIDQYDHRLAYEVYSSIPKSQRSDFIRIAMILMNDREKQLKRMKEVLSEVVAASDLEIKKNPSSVEADMSEPATNMLNFISQLNAQ